MTKRDISQVRKRKDFENELIKKLSAKRFFKNIYKSERRFDFGATLRHYRVNSEKV